MTTAAAPGAPTASTPAPAAQPGGSMLSSDAPAVPAAPVPAATPAAPAATPAVETPPANPASSPPATFEQARWREFFGTGLDEETNKTWSSLSSRINSPQDMAKQYVQTQQEIRNRIRVPANDAKPEEWGEVWGKLGRPEKPDGYKFADKYDGYDMDDTDKSYRDSMRPVLHRIGLNQWQVSEIEKGQVEQLRMQRDAMVAKVNDVHQKNAQQMRTEWGADFDRNMSVARLELQASPDAAKLVRIQLADGTFLGENPDFVRYVQKNGQMKSEDDRTPSVFNSGMRQSAQDQIDTIEKEATAKGLTPTHRDWPHDKLVPLYQKVHGSRGGAPFGPPR